MEMIIKLFKLCSLVDRFCLLLDPKLHLSSYLTSLHKLCRLLLTPLISFTTACDDGEIVISALLPKELSNTKPLILGVCRILSCMEKHFCVFLSLERYVE